MKLQKIGDIQPTLPFTEYDFLQKYRESFAISELGRIHAMPPLKEKDYTQGKPEQEIEHTLPQVAS